MALVTFDMDGVLADTEKAVRKAYWAVGVEMPANAWGMPADEWLPGLVGRQADDIHLAKTLVYPAVLSQFGRELAGGEVLRHIRNDGHDVAIVTHASVEAAKTVRDWLNLLDVDVHPTKDKANTLMALNAFVHVDDQEVKHAPCLVVPFVNNVDTLYARVKEVLPSTQSSSPPATALD